MKKTIKITVKKYYFDISNDHDAATYSNLKAELRQKGIKKFRAIANNREEVNLEGCFTISPAFLFGDQSNTEEGRRVFDWFESYQTQRHNKNIRHGYYISAGFEELQEARKNRLTCGFCGHQYDREGAPKLCTHCLDSPYLEAENLPLLKLAVVGEKRAPLTGKEEAQLRAAFNNRQVKVKAAKTAEKREKITQRHTEAIEVANVEYTGFLWLLDKGINTENCIFYSHSKTFCFGWRKPLDKEVAAKLRKELEHFPFSVEYKEV